MLRIVICDDEPTVLSLLEEGVRAWAEERREEFEISFLVFSDGRIVERGSHDTLLKKGGLAEEEDIYITKTER